MSAPQNFRSAFNGFNREDVVRYLEYINAKHTAQVNELTNETAHLRQQLDEVMASASSETELNALRAELEEAKAVRTALEARCNGLEQELEAALAASKAAPVQEQPTVNTDALELETYRRAERIERQARQRAEAIYHRVNGVLADATAKMDSASGDLVSMAEDLLSQTEQLQSAVLAGKQAIQEAVETMYTLRPEDVE